MVRAALVILFFLQRCSRSETAINPIPRRRRANATPFARFDAFLTPASITVQGDIKGAASDGLEVWPHVCPNPAPNVRRPRRQRGRDFEAVRLPHRSGRARPAATCPLPGVQRKWHFGAVRTDFDPMRSCVGAADHSEIGWTDVCEILS